MMKLKLVFLASVSALGMAAAGTASAAVNSDNGLAPFSGTGDGELFLSVIDRGGAIQRSYVLDLGITANQFLAGDASYLNNISIGADTNLLDILNNKQGTIAWNIAAAHNTLGDDLEQWGYLTTSPTTLTTGNVPSGQAGIGDATLRIGNYLQNVNGTDTNNATNVSKIFPNGDGAFYDGGAWGNTWSSSHSTEGGLDSSLGFYFVAADLTGEKTGFTDGNSSWVQTMLGQWMLDSTGTLTYSADVGGPQVPVPAAVWLLGSALVGMAGIGRRRKSAQAVAA